MNVIDALILFLIRCIFSLALIGCVSISMQAQQPTSSYDRLKFVIAFADRAQVASDVIERKGSSVYVVKSERHLNADNAFKNGDNGFYEGRYSYALRNYNSGFQYYLPKADMKKSDVDAQSTVDIMKVSQRLSELKEAFKPMADRVVDTDVTNFSINDYWTFTCGLNTYAILYHARGNYVQADKLYNFALKIQGGYYGKTSEPYVCTLHNIAMLRKDQGRYNAAEDMLNYVLRYYEKVKGKTSREYVLVLNNKAMLDATLGRTRQAIKQIDEVLALNPQRIFPSHGFDFERMLTNRALLAKEDDKVDEAITFLEKAIESITSREKDDHPDYSDMVVLLGDLYLRKGNAIAYLPAFEKALQKIKTRYGDDNVVYSRALEVLAENNLRDGKFTEAKIQFQSIVNIRLVKLGIKHKDYLSALTRLAVCEWQLNDFSNAEKHFIESMDSYFFLVEKFFSAMSEAEKSSFWSMLKPQVDLFHSFVISAAQKKSALLEHSYNIQLRTKGLLLNNTNQVRDAILTSGDTELIRKYNTWLAAKEVLNSYYNTSQEELVEEQVNIGDQEQWVNELEKELNKRSVAFSSGYQVNQVDLRSIMETLTEAEAAVEIIRINHVFGAQKGKVGYVALVLKSTSENPTLVSLGDGAELEKRFYSYYKNAIQNKTEDKVSYEKYWLSLSETLTNVKTIYVSPDGIYNSINLNTLKKNNGVYIIDDVHVVVLSNTKFITREKAESVLPKGEVMLIGNPAFGNENLISPLPGTKEEVELITQILTGDAFNVKSYLSESAKEEVVKKAGNVAILHIATHGFFLDDVQSGNGSAMGVQLSRAKENPLLRSGIMFSGAAKVLAQEPVIERKDNGILTAYEAMNLSLQQTQLVVLSACETGRGKIVSGEGVYGLSRAFKVAGARAVIISLWKVDDLATQQLMTSFYKLWLKTGNLASAFEQAQKELRVKFPDPYYWGAFVLLEN